MERRLLRSLGSLPARVLQPVTLSPVCGKLVIFVVFSMAPYAEASLVNAAAEEVGAQVRAPAQLGVGVIPIGKEEPTEIAMKTFLQTALSLFVPVLLVIGCVGPRHQPESAVFCPKCKIVWVEMTDFDDPYRMSTVPGEVMECPDCESAVVHFFKTGKLEHACSTCGAELVHCTTH